MAFHLKTTCKKSGVFLEITKKLKLKFQEKIKKGGGGGGGGEEERGLYLSQDLAKQDLLCELYHTYVFQLQLKLCSVQQQLK